MARAATKAKAETVSQSTEITNWDEELAKQAVIAAGIVANTGVGNFFSIKGGILSLNDVVMPNNRMAVVITDFILENVFYEGDYDPEQVTPPTCFAFGRDDGVMGPHEEVVKRGQDQNEKCQGCPMNAFGTADRGKGKACQNRARIGVIPAGEIDNNGNFKAFTDEDHFKSSAVAYAKIPTMSIKGLAAYVKQVAAAMKMPPHGVFTKVTVVPDTKSQFKVVFEYLAPVPRSMIPIVMKRHDETMKLIEQPYNLDIDPPAEEPAPAPKGRGKPAPVSKKPEVKRTKKY